MAVKKWQRTDLSLPWHVSLSRSFQKVGPLISGRFTVVGSRDADVGMYDASVAGIRKVASIIGLLHHVSYSTQDRIRMRSRQCALLPLLYTHARARSRAETGARARSRYANINYPQENNNISRCGSDARACVRARACVQFA